MSSREALQENGLLAQHIPGFTPRPAQLSMADAVESSLQNKDIVIIEAGTGTGKTFAYLVPALLSGHKIIISTGTKNLQDQLFHRDLPILRNALKIPFTAALLKGRNNYLCRHRINFFSNEGQFSSPQIAKDLLRVKQTMVQTAQGDIAELTNVAENSAVWPYVTSTAENCLGQECEYFKDCFLVEARNKAQAADVVIINHHLFCADLVLKDIGFGEILPHADAIIIDEAHQLAEAASQFFGISFSSRQFSFLLKDLERELVAQMNDMPDLEAAAKQIQNLIEIMRLDLGTVNQRKPWQEIANKPQLKETIANIKLAWQVFNSKLELAAPRSKNLELCWNRSVDLSIQFNLITSEAAVTQIHWYETHLRSFSIYLTPLTIAESFQHHLTTKSKSWIFTSATLAVKDSFQHFQEDLGLTTARCIQLPCPFDYETQTRLFIPRNMPDPQKPEYNATILKTALEIINIVKGRTFFLFTSHFALQQAAVFFQKHLAYPLLIQGEMPKTKLLETYRHLGNAVLLGTNSFWEGVDVKGDALSCVIIDKLPFASPSDPILKARVAALRKLGKDPFMDYQLGNAVISLKQGVGRLIRDTTDRGILVICDPRILTKPYGKIFLDSLPPMPITQDINVLEDFFSEATTL